MKTAVLRILLAGLSAVGLAQAQSSNLIYSYILNPGGNQLAIQNGGTIRFNPTNVGESATATFVISNRGTGPAQFTNATVPNEAFRLSGLPLFPNTIVADREVRFTITFAPQSRTQYRVPLQIDVNGIAVIVFLDGSGVGVQYSYQTIAGGTTSDVPAGGPITIADTALGSTTMIRVRIRNDGNASGRINAVTVTGPPNTYQLSDLPSFPATIATGTTIEFALSFTPRETGPQSGQLRLDSISVPISANGTGALLRYTAVTESGSTPILNNGTINFPNTSAGMKSSVNVVVENAGNIDAILNSISASGAGFQLATAPPSPVRVAPNSSVTLTVAFAPEITGSLTGQLQIDDQRINLRGAATTPSPIPAVALTASDTAQPLQQPPVSIRLEAPYPLPLTGKLTLAFASESFAEDPAIQFSTGLRTVDFRIPENTTEAIFSDGSRQIQFQAGTVAGTINLSTTFAVAQVNMTPNPAPSKTVAIAQGAPQLTGVQVTNRNATGFDLLISGYSTSRSVTQMRFQFSAVPGATLQTPSLEQNVEASFTAWYQGSTSRSFGSQFVATIRIQGTGDLSTLQSVNVTATNSRGTSAPATANLR